VAVGAHGGAGVLNTDWGDLTAAWQRFCRETYKPRGATMKAEPKSESRLAQAFETIKANRLLALADSPRLHCVEEDGAFSDHRRV
jgi:hypothetical protein